MAYLSQDERERKYFIVVAIMIQTSWGDMTEDIYNWIKIISSYFNLILSYFNIKIIISYFNFSYIATTGGRPCMLKNLTGLYKK